MSTFFKVLIRFVFFSLALLFLIGAWLSRPSTSLVSASAVSASLSAQPSNPQASFVIQLDTPSVAEIYAQNMTGNVRAADVASITQAQLATVEEQQLALLSQLDALDATLIYRTQRVFNGVAVRINPEKLAQIRALPGVRAVYPLIRKVPTHAISVPLIGAPDLWQGIKGNKLTGEGIRVAVIDTGIDYIHSDLGGTGNKNLYALNDPKVITDSMPFPNTRVVDGYDFVGESYDADPESSIFQPNPEPDPDPMDCYGHGTHVAGTVGGNGVLPDGTGYDGPYNKALDLTQFIVAPGVAPKAQLYALKVFGCTGSSEVTDLAIEWAVDPNGDGDLSDHVDVINMSLGSTYGALLDVSTIAADNAVAAGVIVVASAGNSGDIHYITGSPAVADRVISVAASSYDNDTGSDLLASFSSRGPRRGDSVLKPDIAAPGVGIFSAAYGTGIFGRSSSGTSMAAPHVAGSMALLRELYPDWSVQELKALVMNSAQPVIRTSTIITSPTYSGARIGAGRIDLNAAVATTLLAFNADAPDLVSISFGTTEVISSTSYTRTLAIQNKGNQPVSMTIEYLSQVDLAGAAIALPQTTVSVAAQSMVTVPVVLTIDLPTLQRGFDETLNDIGVRYWLSEEMGKLQIIPNSAAPAIHVPIYANPKAASTLASEKTFYDFGTQTTSLLTLTLTGTALTAADATTGTNSLVSLLALQWQSPNNPPVDPDDPRLVVGSYDEADIRYVGIANDLYADHLIEDTTLYFGIVSYADWSSPKEVQFNILIDANEDGVNDYRVFNSDQFTIINDRFNSDRFTVGIENLATQTTLSGGYLNSMAANQGDAALFGNNLIVIPVRAGKIGLSEGNSDFGYQLESEIAEMTGIVDRSPKLHYDIYQQSIQTLDGDGVATRIVNDDGGDNGGRAQVYHFDAAKAGGDGKFLIFFHHNRAGQRVQMLELVSDIPKIFLPIVQR